MSAPPPQGIPHRMRAGQCLYAANAELDTLPTGTVRIDEMVAHSAKAQVFASAAMAHALLEIGDILRATREEPTVE